jgi:predicted transcriptional regulator
MTTTQRISLQNIRHPPGRDFITNTHWLCDTLGLSSGRDTEKLATEIILSILEETGNHQPVTSESLSELLDISVGRVNHHLRNLHRSGVVYRDKKIIRMRGNTLLDSVREVRKDINRILDELEAVASDIDTHLGLTTENPVDNSGHALIIPDLTHPNPRVFRR